MATLVLTQVSRYICLVKSYPECIQYICMSVSAESIWLIPLPTAGRSRILLFSKILATLMNTGIPAPTGVAWRRSCPSAPALDLVIYYENVSTFGC